MNYLEEIKRLKKAEVEKKARLARIKADKEKNQDEYLSNLTFMNFEKYILNYLPYYIEEGIKRNPFDNRVKVIYSFSGYEDDEEKGLCNEKYNLIATVEKYEFLKYMRHIPGHISRTTKEGKYIDTFELDTLANFYIEKLQELEHYNIDYSENKSR